ncbi:hypothetical protein FJZ31_41345 [Candidatus Poribacteria bacterium]|nr:hypothetical protein [Candidatus Poribacteria bacterium]
MAVPKLEDMHAQLQRFIPESLSQRMHTATLEMTGENRLITTLFADISGFTALTNRHSPENLVDIVNQCFKAIVDAVCRYEGSVNRFIGDNVLAFFGAPIAHENDAERAALAALEMRGAVLALNLNISVGLNTGFMYVGKIGVEQHTEYSAYGPEINLAKRLQDAATAGHILVGPGTYRLIKRAFEFQAVGPLHLKGIDSPVTAYELLRPALHPQKLRGIEELQSHLIGRDREFAILTECAESWLSGRGQMVTVVGEAGIGKTRLVRELKQWLDVAQSVRLRYTWLEGRCLSIGQPVSYWPFLDILRSYFDLTQDDNEPEIASKITEAIKAVFPNRSDEFLPFFGELFSVKFRNELDSRLDHLTPEQLRYLTLMRLRDTFVAIAQNCPLILVLEDLHWADDLSMDLLSSLMDALSSAPLMLLCVYRTEKEHRCWQLPSIASRKCPDLFTEIALKQLTSLESRRLVESLLAIDNLPERVKALILQKSEGNPFFIEEMIRSLIDKDLIYRDGERWKARQEVENLNVPDTVQGLILERVDRLQAEVKYVLQCASVIGRLFRYKLLDYIARQAGEVERYLEQLERRDLVYEERSVPELEYAFKHVLTQEATYQGILENQRKAFHLQVAQGIEMLYRGHTEDYYEELAHHYSRSDRKDKALEYLLKSAEKAKKQYVNETAIEFYQKAIEVADGMGEAANPQRVEIYESLGLIYDLIGRNQNAQEAYAKALEYCTDRRKRTRLYLHLEGCVADRKLKEHYLNLAKETLGDDTNSAEMALIYQVLSWREEEGNPFLAYELVRKGLELVKDTDNFEEIVVLCDAANWLSIWVTEREDVPRMYAQIAYDAAKRSGDRRLISHAMLLRQRGPDYDESTILESIEINKIIGNLKEVIHGYIWLHFCYTNQSECEKAVQALRKGLARARQMEAQEKGSSGGWLKWCLYALGGIYAESGNIEMGERWCEELLSPSPPAASAQAPAPLMGEDRGEGEGSGEKQHDLFYLNAVMAEACYRNGKLDEARKFLSKAMESLVKLSREEIRACWPSRQWFFMIVVRWANERIFTEENLIIAETITAPDLNKRIPLANRTLGKIYLMVGNYEKSLDCFMKGYVYPPKDPKGWEFIVELAQKAPHLEGWKAFLAHLEEKSKDDTEAQEQLRKVSAVWE